MAVTDDGSLFWGVLGLVTEERAEKRTPPMARTKARVLQDHLTAKQKAARAERNAQRRAGLLRAARILSSQELEAREPVKYPARAPSETEQDSETEPEEDTFSRPDPKQVIKLSAEARGGGGRVLWRGRLRGGGADVILTGTWVRQNFKTCVRTLELAHPLPNAHAGARVVRFQVLPRVCAGRGRALPSHPHGQRARAGGASRQGRPLGWT